MKMSKAEDEQDAFSFPPDGDRRDGRGTRGSLTGLSIKLGGNNRAFPSLHRAV
jgi:hypothetical protein